MNQKYPYAGPAETQNRQTVFFRDKIQFLPFESNRFRGNDANTADWRLLLLSGYTRLGVSKCH